MNVLVTGATGYIGSAEEAHIVMGTFADALALDQQVSGAKARKVLGWQPQAISLLDDLKEGSYVG
ncbi:hypothetical protein I8751_27415 [Nostocaceae cyanobacterium CENA357]|uniref:Uncharacterized protein n=1 Tax=Atlanticothrix silvestris CENA357 TaxID=1725252 RepID=A0A8J7HJ00_9CYAN|nr:hypothetical protein [Atlanticothrix silvestris]MBH8556004.1 hypothetical protein [Atlanticothrix silvestris CENA357]